MEKLKIQTKITQIETAVARLLAEEVEGPFPEKERKRLSALADKLMKLYFLGTKKPNVDVKTDLYGF